LFLLIIRDGWGIGIPGKGNAVHLAAPPGYGSLISGFPSTMLEPGGEAVGLPVGQMGNSEVGHMNIGGGRVVYQDLPKISKEFKNGGFEKQPEIQAFLNRVRKKGGGGRIHLLGLVSDGGVHSHQFHIESFSKILASQGFEKFYIHAFTDGRDTSPKGGIQYLAQLEGCLKSLGAGSIASVSGRYYAMDRDSRWDRIERAYDVLVRGKGPRALNSEDCLRASYDLGITDEFILPTLLNAEGCIRKNDHVFFMNFRPDRARQLCFALENDGFDAFAVEELGLDLLTMTPYAKELNSPVVYSKSHLSQVLPEVFSSRGLAQLKIAETEKYAHVTYFLNGGREEKFEGEERILIPSPRVETYDLKPEMSAPELTEKLLLAIESGKYDFVAVNYANPDMVGHTGNLEAAIQAVRVVDACISRVLVALADQDGAALITADHGNLDEMIDVNGEILTAHSLNQVDCIFLPRRSDLRNLGLKNGGKLADIAPTILDYLEIDLPQPMDGNSLLIRP
jgi:2,3-bisphosphoglycerate-independent phosphoglycerate mutase